MGAEPEFGGVSLAGLARAYGLDGCFELQPRGSREAANRLQQAASALVAFDCTHPLCIPTKFYDYAGLRGSMLLLGHVDGAMAAAASRLGVPVLAPHDGPGIDARLDAAFHRWASGAPAPVTDAAGIFHRSKQAERWHDVLTSVIRAG
jgi:hypothetical protein